MYRSLRNTSNNTNKDIFAISKMKYWESYRVVYTGKYKLINVLSRGHNPRINKQGYLWLLSESDCRTILPEITDNRLYDHYYKSRYKSRVRSRYTVGNGATRNAMYVIQKRKKEKREKVKVLEGFIEKTKERAVNYAETAVINTVKNSMGMELDLDISPYDPVYDVLIKFIETYDSSFHKHSVFEEAVNKRIIKDKEFFVKLRKDTFLYICTGKHYWNKHDEAEMLISSNRGSIDNRIYMYFFGKKSYAFGNKLNSLLSKAKTMNDIKYHYKVTGVSSTRNERSGGIDSFSSIFGALKPRKFDTLFFDDPVVKSITDHLDNYTRQKRLFDEKDIIFKTGILLQGQPGTGKTSMASAIATYMNCGMISVDISTLKYIDIAALCNVINSDDNRYVILLEDIDCVVLNRDNVDIDKEDKTIVNKLLQFLDSSVSPTDVIFVATTNHPELLDEALVRAGRFNLVVNVDGITTEKIREMCRSFHSDDISLEDTVIQKLKDMGKNPDVERISQSLVQRVIFESYGNLSINAVSEEESE